MKRTVIKIAALISAMSFLLFFFFIPASAAGEKVNFVTPSGAMPPFHNPSTGTSVIDVMLTNADGYGYIVEFVHTKNSEISFFPMWSTSGYFTNKLGFAYHVKSGTDVKAVFSIYVYKEDGTLYRSTENRSNTFRYPTSQPSGATAYYFWGFSEDIIFVDIPGTFGGNAVSYGSSFVPGGTDVYRMGNYAESNIIHTSNPGSFEFTFNGEAPPSEEEPTTGDGGSVNVDLTETNSWLEKIYNKLQEIFTFLPELKDQSGDKVVGAIEDQNKILQDGEEVPTKKDVNSSDLNDAEAELMPGEGEEVTIPEFDQSLVEGSSTYWEMVEQILDTSGLKPIIIFSLAIGLAAFIIGRKV